MSRPRLFLLPAKRIKSDPIAKAVSVESNLLEGNMRCAGANTTLAAIVLQESVACPLLTGGAPAAFKTIVPADPNEQVGVSPRFVGLMLAVKVTWFLSIRSRL